MGGFGSKRIASFRNLATRSVDISVNVPFFILDISMNVRPILFLDREILSSLQPLLWINQTWQFLKILNLAFIRPKQLERIYGHLQAI